MVVHLPTQSGLVIDVVHVILGVTETNINLVDKNTEMFVFWSHSLISDGGTPH